MTESIPSSQTIGVEPDQPKTKGYLFLVIALFGFVGVVGLFFNGLISVIVQRDWAQHATVDDRLTKLRDHEQTVLSNYTQSESDAAVVHVPIQRAIELAAAHPERIGGKAPTAAAPAGDK